MDHGGGINQPTTHAWQVEVLELPEEVLLRCLSYLPSAELARCREVSSQWQRVAGDGSLWRALLAAFVKGSPYVCVNIEAEDGPRPSEASSWRMTYYRLVHLVCMVGRQLGPRRRPHQQQEKGSAGSDFPACPFCESPMSQPKDPPSFESSPADEEARESRKRLICCQTCDLLAWINCCDRCRQESPELIHCNLCSTDVCLRCFGRRTKYCEHCYHIGCSLCVRPRATFTSTNRSYGGSKKKKNRKGTKIRAGHQQQQCQLEQDFLCTRCGVVCCGCDRIFEDDDADFCVACESAVCYSCDCPCGALNMFE